MIVVKLMGGLGNQMFQYATAYALSKKHNTRLAVDTSWFNNQSGVSRKATYELNLLGIDAEIAKLEKYEIVPKKPLFKKLTEEKLINFEEKSLLFNPKIFNQGKNLYLNGYWQSEKYFIDYRFDILKVFEFPTKLSRVALSWKSQINKSEAISLHIRRGDYVTNSHTNTVHGVLNLEYYENAVKYLSSYIKNPKVFVFSDDPSWCKENLKLSVNYEIVSGPNSIEDMYLMSICRHNIIANSSFSWWAAWLNKNDSKIVIAPFNWFNDKSLKSKDIVPSSWKRI